MQNPEALQWILDRKITPNSVELSSMQELRSWLEDLAPRKQAEFLIGGVSVNDLPAELQGGSKEIMSASHGRAGLPYPHCQTLCSPGTPLVGFMAASA